ncbi:MAG: carboxypeptidase-like regulatory domain-containing protein [Bryobacteraceae bacterium]
MRLALSLLASLPLFAQNASLTGTVLDTTGAYVPKASAELNSGIKKYQAKADDTGVYRFVNLPAGEYTLKISVLGFKTLTIKFIALSDNEQKRTPDVTLETGRGCGDPSYRDFVRLLPSPTSFGRLSGSVLPAMAGVQITLVCRTFQPCGSTKTDSSGAFSFEMLSAGVYGLSFSRAGFFPEDARGYFYTVNTGLESVYGPILLEKCPDGNCEAKIQRILPICE